MNWQEYTNNMQSWGLACIDAKSFTPLKFVTEITPREYLDFANKDLLLDTKHGYVNSLSNAKRAIDCQIQNLLAVLGLKTSGNIHRRIERIKEVSVLAPRILKKVNKIRNLLEHEFQRPSEGEAEDAVDVATLFIEATDKVFLHFMDSFWVAKIGTENHPKITKENGKTIIEDDNLPSTTFSEGLYFQYDESSKDYGVWAYRDNQEVFEGEIIKGSQLHIALVRLSILNHYTSLELNEDIVANEFVAGIVGMEGIHV